MLLIRIGFLLCLSVLTVLLLVPDPRAVTGIDLPGPLKEHLTHFILFTGLTLWAHASRWPFRFWILMGLLTMYAVGTESLQALSPTRHVEAKDFIENMLGIMVGTVVWWPNWKQKKDNSLESAENRSP